MRGSGSERSSKREGFSPRSGIAQGRPATQGL
jgi:hypothetical protein